MPNNVPSLQTLCTPHIYAGFPDARAVAAHDDHTAFGLPRHLFETARELEILNRLPIPLQHELRNAEHWERFRFHPSTAPLVQRGLYVTACYLSLERARAEIGEAPHVQSYDFLTLGRHYTLHDMDDRGGVHIGMYDEETGWMAYRIAPGQELQPVAARADGLSRYIPASAVFSETYVAQASLAPLRHPVLFRDAQGRFLVAAKQTEVPTLLPHQGDDVLRTAAVSENGRFLAGITQDGDVWRQDVMSNQHLYIPSSSPTLDDRNAIQVSVSNDGELYVGSHDRGYLLTGNSSTAWLYGPRGFNGLFRLSPDERYLIHPSPDGPECDFCLTDRHHERRIEVRRHSPSSNRLVKYPSSIAFSPLNALVAVGYLDGVVELFDLAHADGADEARSLTHVQLKGILPQASFSPGFDRLHIVTTYPDHRSMTHTTLTLGSQDG